MPLNSIPGWIPAESPFHNGEDEVHDRLGIRTAIEQQVRRAGIRDYLTDQHREFFPQLPYLAIGRLDADGQPWASLRYGVPGFVHSLDAHTLRIEGSAVEGDPAGPWQVDEFVGTLGIQFPTRRRNRVNGVLTAVDAQGATLKVWQTFGNCKKYIQARTCEPADMGPTGVEPDSDQLSDSDQLLVGQADTFFIASANLDPRAGLARGADVSHKGGRPGFVRMDDERTLTIPDFVGNSYFNTIGNLVHHPRAGLLFVDFGTGDLLFAAALTEVLWDDPQTAGFAGALRLVRFHLQRVRRCHHVLPLRWSAPQYADQLARTGTWQVPVAA
ncbi:MAG TPA: pyridoxamine 5'-phosphate oxidase family protein [Castellaniella sp.]|uniref:pyridoxamine 5'-phosphate oxidase family protein n=1 Tax=Castellaniella sp. TaxID=1955812 RepID=UPI002F128850